MLRKAIYCLAILQMAAAAVTEICDESKEILCREQNNCDQCIQAHSCCSYCYDQSFKGSRCDFRENLLQNGCPEGLLEKTGGSTRSKVASGGNEDFSDYTVKNGATQLKPQHFKLYLRKGESQRIQFSYRPTRNYPLDLYYLMDVSYTMSDDIDTITSLGNQLAENLRKLTNNFRLALGLYSEKNAMPFSYTLKEELVEHCYENRAECVEGFDFKHRLNFTSKISDFIQKVGALKQETTMNIDEPEAGLDALMQIMSCERYMNRLPDSRKIVVMATDGTLHWAGDGILMGGVKRNFSRCWLDENGVYTKALENDYPSLEEVYRKLQHTKTNAVFAAKSNVFDYYKSINALMPDLTFTAKLEERSRNVIELVKSGYSSFIKHIKFSTNTTEAPELKITFRTNCSELNYLNETQTCENIAEGMVYVFDVEIALRDDFMGQRTGTTIYIEEQDINERVQIDIEYIGTKCECVNEIKPSVAQNCKNGDYRCGKCNCFEGSTGQFCNLTCHDSVDYCRQNIGDSVSLICNRRGDCDCGYCKCDFGYTGKYCQHSCPIAHRKVCDDHGVCIEGKCDCHPGYTGETCSCSLSKNTCRIPEAIEDCSGRGVCKCGKCDCTEDFYGDYCEKCSGCSGFCSIYAERVVEHFTKEQKESQEETGKRELVFINGDTEAIEELCTVRYPKDETFCETNYKYHINPSVVTIYITANECRKPIAATMKVGVAVGILLAIGIFAICCYKCYIVRQDKIEYARFEEKQKREMKSENPIYVSPISSYEVPLEMRNLREKDD